MSRGIERWSDEEELWGPTEEARLVQFVVFDTPPVPRYHSPGGEHTMDEPIAVGPKTAAEYRAALAAMLAELERLDERSARTWAEIDRLKAESSALQAENELIKASIDRRLQALVELL